MVSAKPYTFRRELTEALTKKAFALTKPRIPSRTLRGSLTWYLTKRLNVRGYLEVPHYWAVYYHEGVVGPIRPRRAKVLVWFESALKDPRLNKGKGPQRFKDVKRLTKAQYEEGLRRNYLRQRRKLKPYMIVVRARKGFLGIPFYVHALGGGTMVRAADQIASRYFKAHMKQLLKESGVVMGRVEKISLKTVL